MTQFSQLISEPALLKRLQGLGYVEPTPIQEAAIPHILAGENLMAAAPTGTGKTAAFVLPVLQLLMSHERPMENDYVFPRVLVIAPTRELAQQLAKDIREYGRNSDQRCLLLCGGQKGQELGDKIARGGDIVVGTPGRLFELIQQDVVDMSYLQCLILDEADRLLDLGFADDLKRIIALLPDTRQNLMFSATFDDAVRQLAGKLMPGAIELGQKEANRTNVNVRQWLVPVDHHDKGNATVTLLKENRWRQVMVFTKTKKGADALTVQLKQEGFQVAVLHGDKRQSERDEILNAFRDGKLRVLVTTDVASRGIDIENLPAVVNHDLPPVAHDYIHRIGRTGRAGEKGIAISLVAAHEIDTLTAIETLIGRALPRQDLIGHVPDHRVRETGPGKRVKNMRKPKLESNKPTEPKASKNNKTSTKKDDKRPEKSLDASHGKPRGGAMLTNRGKGKDKKTATQRKID